MYSSCRRFRWLAAVLWLGAAVAGAAGAERVLRVAADPNNLPFSNARGEGFENKLAEIVARDLGARVEYLWWPQRRGFFRETLGAGRADLVMGVPAGFERVLTTAPYYRSTYVFVRRPDAPAVTSLEDPRLARLRIGVQLAGEDGVNTPPAHALARQGLVDNVRGYTLYGDYAGESPPAAIVRAVSRGEIDVAVAWGPMAGYFAAREPAPLAVAAVEPCPCQQLPMSYAIAVGVRRGEPALRDAVQGALDRHRAEIGRLLAGYHVPQLSPGESTEAPHADSH